MFIVFGSPRSGTTLLAQVLAAHPDVVVPEETDFIIPCAFIFDRVQDLKLRKAMLSSMIVNSSKFESTIGTYLSSRDIVRIVDNHASGLGNLLNRIYAEVAVKGGGRIAGDKSPNDLNFLRMVAKVGGLTSGIRIVHIVRDIRDVMSSLLPLNWAPQLELYFPRLWSSANLYLHAISQGKPEYLLIRYEDFVRDPAAAIDRACQHLGVEWTSKQLAPEARHPRYRNQPVHAGIFKPISTSSIGNYRQKLDAALVESIEKQAAEAMSVFGYEFASPFGQAYRSLCE